LKRGIFILFLSACVNAANAQTAYLDSLKGVLSITAEDTARVLLLSEISLWSIFSNPDTSLQLAKEGIRLAQRLNYPKGEAYCKRSSGFFFWSTGDYTTAIKLAFTGIPYAEKSKDLDLLEWLYSLLLNAYRDNGDFDEAIRYDRKSRGLYQKLNHSINAKDDAITASIYYGMGDLDSARHYIELSMQQGGISDGWTCMVKGQILTKANEFDSALHYFSLGGQMFLDDNNFKDLTNLYQSISTLYRSAGDIDSSIHYATSGLQIARLKSFEKEHFVLCSLLADLYDGVKSDSTLKYYKLAMVAKDSLFNKEKTKQVLSVQFDEELRQQEIINAEIQYKNRLKTYGLIAGLIIFLVVAVILWLNNLQKKRANLQLQQQKKKVESTLSELRSTQAQLIQSEKMASLGELTAGIAHEIQNPLNFVNNFSEVNNELIDELKEEAEKGNIDEVKIIADDIKENSEKINHHGKRADAIVKGMLQHSRSSSGTKEPTDINALCDEYLRLAYHGLRAKDKSFNTTLETNFDSGIGQVKIVPQDIGRVILNLINNAFYAAPLPPEGGFKDPDYKHNPTVWVRTKKVGDKVFISVRDNGPGIPQKILDKIFQPFFTTKPTGQGTGLGLSLAYDIIKEHGGDIKVETKEGEGSEFIIQLQVI
jgi:two-component system NtrC family sensor kinase